MGCRLSGPWMSDGTMGVSAQDLRYIQNHEALRILTGYEQPITVQIEGRRGRSLQYSRPSDSSTQTERPKDNATSDRQCYSHITLPGRNHGDGGRYEYLPNTPRDLEDIQTSSRHDPEFSPKDAEKHNCLLSCCSSNMDEPSSFQSQTEDEDYMMEKTVGYLPLHHELDSGLGWTDGSFHQGELSGLETEEGLDECHTHQGGRAARVRGGSPSSESFISSELSDSGFYSVSTAEFLHFQRLLEKRMRMYNSRLHHQGELQNLCMDTQKAHRELEAIPEALTMQPDSECVETEAHPHQMVRVTSMQLRKNERPNLNRHSSSSAAIFSTCSSPSGQQRVLTPCATTAAGMLRRSRTLHHRPVPVEQRRRASHPTSPNYCSMTLNRYRHALQQQIPEETKTDAKYYTRHANQPVHHANHLPYHVSHATNHANHITHHVNHPTHHASYSSHQANHPTNNRHLANYTTLHANHPTRMANQAAHHANDFTHPTRHANLSPHPYHATLPAQHTHHTHSAFSSHSPHHDHAHTTLLTQHTHHDHPTLPAQHTHHDHTTLLAQHTHHDHTHTTLLAQHTHHDHAHTTLPAQHTHNDHAHPTLPAQHTHNDHTHPTLPAQHTNNDHAHPTLPAQHTNNDHAHPTLPAQHTNNDHAHPTLPAQHTHNDHAHPTLPAQHTHHDHTTLPAQHTHHDHTTLPAQHTHHDHTHTTLPAQHTHNDHPTLPAQHTHHDHTHTTFPAQHTHHNHTTLPAQHTHNDHAHLTLPAQHTHNDHAHPTLPTQHTHHDHSHTTLSAQHTHHDHSHNSLPVQHTLQANNPPAPHFTNHTHINLPTQHIHNANDALTTHSPHHGHTHTMLPHQHTHHANDTPASHSTNQDHAHTTLSARDTHQGHTHTMLSSHGTHRGDAYTMLPPHAPRQTHATLPTQQAHHILRTRPKHAISQPSLSSSTDDHHFAPPQEPCHHDNRGRSFTEPPTVVKVECEKETSGERERGRYHTLSHTPSQEGNDTWPKTTNRHGPYSTLEGHMTTTTLSASKPPVGPSNPRAMRNQLLRERALRVADERSGGISTDDETNVEIRRVGRYWSRSERREQVLQKQRQKREALRGGGANSNTSVGGDSSGYSALMELSQRKLSRLRNRKLLDDWTTVEELLTHGTRLGTHDENIQIPNSLLTVTTV